MIKRPLTIAFFLLGLLAIAIFVGVQGQNLDILAPQDSETAREGSESDQVPTNPPQAQVQRSKEEIQEVVRLLIQQGNETAKQERWDEALGFFKEAHRLAPNHREVLLGLGRLSSVVAMDDDAATYFDKAIALSLTSQEKAQAHAFFGLFLKERNRDDEAIQQYQNVIAEQPQLGEAYFHLGDLHRSNGRFEMALSYYKKALLTHPGHAPSRMGREFCLIRLHRYAEARTRLEEDLQIFPRETTFYHALARILSAAPGPQVRNGPQALNILRQLIQEVGLYPQIAESLAMAFAEVGNFKQAEIVQAKAIEHAGLDFPQKQLDQMEALRQQFAAGKPCRQPWHDDDPIFYRKSYEPKQSKDNRAGDSWKAEHLDMPTRLTQIASQADVSQMIYLNEARAKKLRDQLDAINELEPFLFLQPQYATELLRAGRSIDAKLALEKIEEVLKRNGQSLEGEAYLNYLHAIALTNFRLGEQENCQAIHNAESCILPIREGGIHQIQRGSRGAIEKYKQILEIAPDDLRAKWFLNLAYMTLGEYPAGVPKKFLIDPEIFESKEPFPHFSDIAGTVGLDLNTLAGGVIADDFDNDGFLDLFISQWGLLDQIHYFRNLGDGTFENNTKSAGLAGITGGLNILQADYNNDGYMDVFILRGAWMGEAGEHPNSLLRNNGDQTFTDVTEAAGILSFRPTQTATWLDYNNDGHLDLFIGNESGKTIYPCELFQNMGDGTFREVAKAVGIADPGHTKAVASGDFDGDGKIDLFLSRYGQPNRLFRNLGPSPGGDQSLWHFEEVAEKAGVEAPLKSFPAWFFDYDNDGHLDLFVSDYSNTGLRGVVADYLGQEFPSEKARLYRNLGNGKFENVTAAAGLDHPFVTMGSNFGDIDNDGFLDFYLGTGTPLMNMVVPNRLFHNQQGKAFVDVTTAAGFGHLQKGHGISFADLDNDGDQDVYAVMGGAFQGDTYPNALFQNPGFGNQWLKIKLKGNQSNTSGIGARIAITVRNGNNPPRTIYKTVNSGGSFGANPLRLEIGLGPNAKIEKAEVFWPATSQTQDIQDLKPNRAYLVEEGKSEPSPIALQSLTLGGGESSGHHH